MFEPLARYAEIGAALCPIPAGGKQPSGLIGSFAHEWSRDPAQWFEWSQKWPGCNWIMVCGPSKKIVVDIDVKNAGIDVAWQAWVTWCTERGLTVFYPHVETPSQGWHVYFDVPPEANSTELRQPSLITNLIDIRAGNGFVLIPPSQIDGKSYRWLA